MPFIHTRRHYFTTVIGELLYWLGEDRLLFASDYAIWRPKWLIERFVDFEIPADMTDYPPLTTTRSARSSGSTPRASTTSRSRRSCGSPRRPRAGWRSGG